MAEHEPTTIDLQRDAGLTVTWDDNFPGHRRFYVADNLGNRLEFLQRDGSTPEW